jgi:hypothetical protein
MHIGSCKTSHNTYWSGDFCSPSEEIIIAFCNSVPQILDSLSQASSSSISDAQKKLAEANSSFGVIKEAYVSLMS